MKKIQKNRGVTLITLILYIILALVALGMLGAIMSSFRANINGMNAQSVQDTEFDKLNLQFLKETKTEGNTINEDESNSSKIVFSNGNVYTYDEEEQAVYLNDSIKIAQYLESCTFEIKTVTIDDDSNFNTTREYEDKNGDVAVIPAGFIVSGLEEEQTIDTGLVIYQYEVEPSKKQSLNVTAKINDIQRTTEYVLVSNSNGSNINWADGAAVAQAQQTYDQFVWIPIKNTTDANAQDINDMYICQAKTGSNGNCSITVENGQAKCTTHNSTLMAGRLYAAEMYEHFEEAYTKVYTPDDGLREPDVVTGNGTNYDGSSTYLTQLSSILGTEGYDTTANFKESLQEEYNEIVKSVYENQGFYIGRYETSGMINSNTNATVKSVAGTNEGIRSVTWYRMYAQQKKYAENKNLTSVKSSMIQGAAYDQVMKFVENGTRPDGGTYTIKTVGNVGHESSSFTTKPYQTGGRDYATNYTGSTPYNDKVKNIYDLEGNVRIWTTEAYSTGSRVSRGRLLRQQLFSQLSPLLRSEQHLHQLWFVSPALRSSVS